MCKSIKHLIMIATVLGAAGMLVLIAVGSGTVLAVRRRAILS
jgi:hypothetical protein